MRYLTLESRSQSRSVPPAPSTRDNRLYCREYWELKIQYAKVEIQYKSSLSQRRKLKEKIKELKEELLIERQRNDSLTNEKQELISSQKPNHILKLIMFFITVFGFVVGASLSTMFGQILTYDVAFAYFLVKLSTEFCLIIIFLFIYRDKTRTSKKGS